MRIGQREEGRKGGRVRGRKDEIKDEKERKGKERKKRETDRQGLSYSISTAVYGMTLLTCLGLSGLLRS